ncbi:MAG: histidinol-phosphate transaminase [Armatimonadetes bacterium]|nr:histidinol-phosphate transaminase [Armatimonadota bacterium]
MEKIARPSIQRIVPYSPGKPTREVQEELGPIEVVKLASNENPLGPSPLAVEAMRAAAEDVHVYPDPVCAELTAALAEKWDVDPEGILIGRGSDEVIHMLGLAFVNPGDEIVYSDPPFALYPLTADLMDGKSVRIPARDFTHDLPAFADAIGPRTKLVFISNPYNPTGTIVTAEQVEEFMARVPDTCIVVFDEAYYEYVADPAFPSSLDYVRQGRRVAVLRTFSKAYGLAGLRVGYGMTTPEIAQVLKQVRPPFNISSMAQVAAVASLRDPSHAERSAQVVAEGREYLYAQFERLGLSYVPSQANFVFFDAGVDSRWAFDQLMRRGVTVRTGDIFGFPTYLRVTVGTPEQNAKFISALEEALKAQGSRSDAGGTS